MKIINIKGLLLLSLFTLLGCNDEEFLKEEPKSFYTIDNIFSSGVQVEQSIISLYSVNFDDMTLTSIPAMSGMIIEVVTFGRSGAPPIFEAPSSSCWSSAGSVRMRIDSSTSFSRSVAMRDKPHSSICCAS